MTASRVPVPVPGGDLGGHRIVLPAAAAAQQSTAAGSTTFEVTVYGVPAPQGSKRYVGRGIMVESSAKVKPWREAVKHAITPYGPPALLEGALMVTVVFTVPKPGSAPKRIKTWPAKRPDLDKLLRSTFDGLGEAGVWKDDAQVVHVVAAKVYPNEGLNALDIPGARIWVSVAA